LFGNATARRTSGLDRLEAFSFGYASANVKHDFAKRYAHRNSNQAGVDDAIGEGEDSRPLAPLRANFCEPFATISDHEGCWQGFQHYRSALDSPEARIQRDKGNKGVGFRTCPQWKQLMLFSRHKQTLLPHPKFNGETECNAQDIVAQQIEPLGLPYSRLKPLDSQRIFCLNINEALLSTDNVCHYSHALKDSVGVAFKDCPVHVSTGIAFVSVADDKLAGSVCFRYSAPFETCWVASTSS